MNDIFSYIQSEEEAFKKTISLPGNWSWNMKEHLETSYLYIHSQLTTGKSDWKPVKNIIRPILNLQHRTEDIEVKDVQIYVDDPSKYHLSFLVKKYHDDVFVKENDMETFFDELNVSRIDYGAGLSKQLNRPAPEVVPLHSIAFCDQTDILSGPIGITHYYSPDQLLAMKSVGWGDSENGATSTIEDLIKNADEYKKQDNQRNDTPGRYIEIKEVHGNLPKKFAEPNDTSGTYETRIYIVGLYPTKDGKKGVILFTKKETESPFKLIKRDPVYGRSLGFGGAEELFDAQVWTNYDMLRKQDMLDAASKTILKTTDPGLASRNNLKDMDNLEIVQMQMGTDIVPLDTFPRNLVLFDNAIKEWEEHAHSMGAASEAVMGDSPNTNTPFRLQQVVIQQGLGLHEYRRGQYAKHLEEIYQDWIIPHIEKKITQGMTFLSELSLEEMQYLTDCLVTKLANEKAIEMVINGEDAETIPAAVEQFKELVRSEFKKKGSKHFIEIIKGEFKGLKFKVKVSIKSKSKDLSARVDGLVNVFRQIIANPAVLTIPSIARIFNDIIESSGFDPADFTGITHAQLAAAQPQSGTPGTEQMTQRGYDNQPQNA